MNRMERKQWTAKQIKYCDIMAWAAFAMMLIIRGLTTFFMAYTQIVTKAEIQQISVVYEANPAAKMMIDLGKIGIILTFMIPAAVMALYFFLRRRVKQGRMEIDALSYYVSFLFMLMLMNIVNDGAWLMGRIMQGG